MTTTITLEHVHFRYTNKTILTDVCLRVEQGQVVALLGPSGCGKSTVLRLILGFEVPTQGTILVGNQKVSCAGDIIIPPEERNLAVVFQDLALWPHLTVHGNLAFGLHAKGVCAEEQQTRIHAVLEQLELIGKAQRYPGELSGGERQRVAIARALVLEPRAILLDEPLANLDVRLKREMLAVFRHLFEERNSTVLYVTHDLREAVALSHRLVMLDCGQVVYDGSLDDLQTATHIPFVRAVLQDLLAPHPAGQPRFSLPDQA